jgi:SNF2 family DNA or RNA helicase
MRIVHGTWIPEATEDFTQNGAFYLWVETDAPLRRGRRRTQNVHPRHLVGPDLAAFLMEKLGVREYVPVSLVRFLCQKRFLLPTVEDRPLPSFELLRYVDDEVPLEYALAPWSICCYPLRDVLTALADIHFLALQSAEDFQLGADLVFWQQFAQILAGIIAKDQYIPALKYQELAPGPGKRQGTKREQGGPDFKLHGGWELLSESYETAIARYAAAMPAICRAGMAAADDAVLFAAEPLLRHMAEYLLRNIVAGTRFTGAFERQVADTLLYRTIYPYGLAPVQAPAEALEDYKHWLAWRKRLTEAHTDAGFTLCFRLEEASPTAIDDWRLHFIVAAKHDPSLQMSLAEYWAHSPKARSAAAQPFDREFEKNLLLALGYAARIYPTIWTGLATDQPSGCSLTLDVAFAFLKESAWVLEDAGYRVIVPAWWTPEGRRRARIRLKTAARPAKGSSAVGSGHFSFDTLVSYEYRLSIGGQVVTEEEWRQLVQAKTPLVQFRGQWMELDRDKMQQLLEFWQTHRHQAPELTLLDLLKLEGEAEDDLEWEHDPALAEMLDRLHDKSAFAPVADPASLQGTLRDYQRRGVAWLQYLEGMGLHPCLADDMGLGKTIEVIARLLNEREEIADLPPTLVIAPTSVLGNWRKEIERFAPHLRVLVHQGGARTKDEGTFAESCGAYDVVLTSFTLARLDEKLLRGVAWRRVVVDEAQNIKNPQAAQTRAILKLTAAHRLALTGTPVENRLRDLWSIFNFLNPGYLGKEAQFRRAFELPIQRDNDQARSATLKKLVEPFILRRVKTDKRIIDDLPEKIEQIMYCTLTPEQASLYEAVVKDVAERLEEAEGIGRKGLILSTLLRLKQICNHPAQYLQDGSAFSAERSLKLQRLGEMLEEVIESGETALVFTQFTEIGDALDRHLLHTRHYNTYYLHGGTSASRRDRMVAEFQDPATEPSVFILSLRAGGVGLNLTKANHVFHFDRWWNPAVEDQATDRAFRIGQARNVFVHKFVAVGTMEERIDALISDKRRLSSLVVGTDESWLTELDNDTFKELIALRRSAVVG